MIWFNRGLVEEKRGNAINATAAFTIANVLRPTAAAKAKLAGKTPCPIDVEHALVTGEAKVVEGADWIALVKALPFDEPSTATTKEDAWMLATGERTEPALPITISAGDSTEGLVPRAPRGAGLRDPPGLGRAVPGHGQLRRRGADATDPRARLGYVRRRVHVHVRGQGR
ncbi:MAG: hypothetical protein IPQ07_36345 [Myxococcales bacterium]|nr:hypothetical protein [Myxococcales bacterium]